MSGRQNFHLKKIFVFYRMDLSLFLRRKQRSTYSGEKSFLQFPVEPRLGQSPWSESSSGVRTFTSSSNPLKESELEEMYDVTFSSYDENGLKWLRYDRDEQ